MAWNPFARFQAKLRQSKDVSDSKTRPNDSSGDGQKQTLSPNNLKQRIEDMAFNGDTSHWPGFDALKHLFIFGDSYSSTGFALNLPPPKKIDSSRKTVPFKGLTYADEDGTNWVGYLLMQHRPHPDLLVHNYATGGARVTGGGTAGSVEMQVNHYFLEGYAMAPQENAGGDDSDGGLLWNANESLFITWVGINDCAYSRTHTDTINLLFDLQEKLYSSGARIFLFIDVPPIARTPVGARTPPERDITITYLTWNTTLRAAAQTFATAHPDARVFTFSALDAFNRILDNPRKNKLPTKDLTRGGGKVWRDHLHPTSRVHELFAKELVGFLKGVPPREEG